MLKCNVKLQINLLSKNRLGHTFKNKYNRMWSVDMTRTYIHIFSMNLSEKSMSMTIRCRMTCQNVILLWKCAWGWLRAVSNALSCTHPCIIVYSGYKTHSVHILHACYMKRPSPLKHFIYKNYIHTCVCISKNLLVLNSVDRNVIEVPWNWWHPIQIDVHIVYLQMYVKCRIKIS